MERRDVDSQERSNSPIAENRTDTRGVLVVQEGGRQAPGREGGGGWAGKGPNQSWGLCVGEEG